MLVDLRKDAPDQTDVLDPEKLSTEVEKLKSIQSEIKSLEDRAKDLKNDEKHFSCIVIPKLMEDMNLKSLKLRDGSELLASAPAGWGGKGRHDFSLQDTRKAQSQAILITSSFTPAALVAGHF